LSRAALAFIEIAVKLKPSGTEQDIHRAQKLTLIAHGKGQGKKMLLRCSYFSMPFCFLYKNFREISHATLPACVIFLHWLKTPF